MVIVIAKFDISAGYYNRLQSTARTQNPQVKVLLGLGGWTDSTNGEKYSKLVTSKTARDNFVTKTVKMLETRGFDGLSLEWHFPVCWQSNCLAGKAVEKAGFADLVQVKMISDNLLLHFFFNYTDHQHF